MLDFSDKIYTKIYQLALKTGNIAFVREYPPLYWNKQQLKFRTIQEALQKKFADTKLPCGLYTHFPFCERRCTFCKYYSEIENRKEIFDAYLDALENELRFYQIDFSKVPLDNVFFGGGTPTLLGGKQIERYANIIYRFFKLQKDAQVTIEGTPETLNKNNLKTWKNAGVERASIGVQSFNDRILKMVGRNHTVGDVFRVFDNIKKVGIRYTGIDLIWGLPGESAGTYQKTLKDTIRLNPDFIECYLLTSGGRVKIKPFYPPDIKIDEVIQLFKEGFLKNGYQIDFRGNFISFIKKGVKRDKAVNRNTVGVYDYRTFCLGIGAGASSEFSDIKYHLAPDAKKYIKDLKKEKTPPTYYGFFMSKDDYKRQYLIHRFGLYRELDKKRYYELFRKEFKEDFPQELNYLKKIGVVSETKNKFIWHFQETELGRKDFFEHAIRHWYTPQYIQKLIKDFNL